MKKRLRKKLEKENIFINNFICEYRTLKNTKEENNRLLKNNIELNKYIKKISPKEVVISKAMYFGLIGYLPKDLKVFLSSYKCKKLPIKLGGIPIEIGKGLYDDNGKLLSEKLLEELFIEEINEKEGYVIFLFKGFKIRVKIPIKVQYTKIIINGVKTETTCWNWDFAHTGIRIISDNDFSSMIIFYKTSIELSNLCYGNEPNSKFLCIENKMQSHELK